MTYDVQWFTLTSGRTPQDNLFGDQKFWRTKFLDSYKKHFPFKSLDSFVGNPSVNFQRVLKHPMADAYYDAMLPTREQFQRIAHPIHNYRSIRRRRAGRAHVLPGSSHKRLAASARQTFSHHR